MLLGNRIVTRQHPSVLANWQQHFTRPATVVPLGGALICVVSVLTRELPQVTVWVCQVLQEFSSEEEVEHWIRSMCSSTIFIEGLRISNQRHEDSVEILPIIIKECRVYHGRGPDLFRDSTWPACYRVKHKVMFCSFFVHRLCCKRSRSNWYVCGVGVGGEGGGVYVDLRKALMYLLLPLSLSYSPFLPIFLPSPSFLPLSLLPVSQKT